jgi:hypothetical protein
MKNKNLTQDSIKYLLNHSASQIDRTTAESLRNSRNLALERHRKLQHEPVQAWLTHHGLWSGSTSSSHKHVYFALAVLFSLCLYSGIAYMQHDRDHSDIDIELLTDDLPVDAYVDQ